MSIDQAIEVATEWMDTIVGVTGVGQGQCDDGSDAIIVYTNIADASRELPSTLDGIPVLVKFSGTFEAQKQ